MRYFRLRTIRSRILCAMLMLSMIPLALLGIISLSVSREVVSQQVEEIHSYNITTYDRNISLVFDNLRQASREFLYGKGEQMTDKIMSLLEKEPDYYEKLSVYKQAELKKLFESQVSIMMPSNIQADEIIFDNLNGLRFRREFRNDLAYTYVTYGTAQKDYEELYQMALKSAEKEIFVRSDQESFTYLKIIFGLKRFNAVGYFVINVDSDVLQSILPAAEELDNAAYVVVDTHKQEDPQIVFSVGRAENLEKLVQQYYDGTLVQGGEWKTGRVTNASTGWDVMYFVNKEVLLKKAFLIGKVTAGFIVLTTAIVLLLGIWIAGMLNRPLAQLSNAIRKVEEQGAYTIEETFSDDEIGKIGNQFKNMVEQNLSLKEGIYKAEIKKKEAELTALQAQINPHFLYNTLDAIYLMTQIGRPQDAGKMILALSEMFKTSLNKGQEFISVRDEIEHIKNYLYIQKMRYGDRINYTLNIAEELLDERMLKLVLQPIIENGICHGLELKKEGGVLAISGCYEENEIRFVIQDNGAGMEEGAWKKGYGLNNVNQRIKLYYGEDYGIAVESRPGEGTIVTVRLSLTPEMGKWRADAGRLK